MSESLQLRCIGTGDAFGSGGRLNSCYLLQAGEERLLMDCGCSSLIGLQRCGVDPATIDTIVISHLHGDHFGGIPFLFLEAKFVSRRQRPLTLIGPPGLQTQVDAALEALYPGTINDELDFPLVYRQLESGRQLTQGCFQIGCCQVKHGRSRDVYALRVDVAGRAVAFTGDTEWTDNLIALSDGTDLVLAECFAYAQPVPSHLDYQTLLQQRDKLNCQRLLLTHLGPEMLEKRAELKLEFASDGDLIEF